MNLFDIFFGREKSSQVSKKGKPSRAGFSPRLEPLEERQLLAANPLQTAEGAISAALPTMDLGMSLDLAASTSGIFAVHVNAKAGSTLDPAKVQIYKASDTAFATPLTQLGGSAANIGTGDNSSIVYVKLEKGDYVIRVAGENGTVGQFKCDVFLPGSLTVTNNGEAGNQTSIVADSGKLASFINYRQTNGFNEVTVGYFDTVLKGPFGLSGYFDTKYDSNFDYNGDGAVSQQEVATTTQNESASLGVVTVTISADNAGPAGSLNLISPNDAAKAANVTDLTGDKLGTLTITDPSGIASARIGFGTGSMVNVTGITAGATSHTIELTKDFLKASFAANGPINAAGDVVPGTYKLYLSGTDGKGHTTENVIVLEFSVVGTRTITVTSPPAAVTAGEKTGYTATVAATFSTSVGGNGEKLAYSSTIDPATGTITFDTAVPGKFTFVPGSKYAELTPGHTYTNNEDKASFRITVTDLVGNTSFVDVTATITPVGDKPLAVADALTIDLADGTTATLEALKNDTDVDKFDELSIGDKIKVGTVDYTFDSNGRATIPVTVGGVSKSVVITRVAKDGTSAAGLVTKHEFLIDVGTSFDSLKATETATVKFSYTVKDNGGIESDPAEVTLTVKGKNDAPVITADIALGSFDLSVPAQDTLLKGVLPIVWTATDVDGDAITVTKIAYGGADYVFTGAAGVESKVTIKTPDNNITWEFTRGTDGKALSVKTSYVSPQFGTVSPEFTFFVSDGSLTDDAKITMSISGTHVPADMPATQDIFVQQVILPTGVMVPSTSTVQFTKGGTGADYTYAYSIVSIDGTPYADSPHKDNITITVDGHIEIMDNMAQTVGTHTLVVEVQNTSSQFANDSDTGTVVLKIEAAPTPAPAAVSISVDDTELQAKTGRATNWPAPTDTVTWTASALTPPTTMTVSGHTGTDNVPGSGFTASIAADGTFTFDPGTAFAFLSLNQTATLTYTYTATESRYGTSASGTITVTVTGLNAVPTVVSYTHDEAVFADDQTTGTVISVGDLAATDTDAEDTLVFSKIGTTVIDVTTGPQTVTFADGARAVFAHGDTTQFTFYPPTATTGLYHALSHGTNLPYVFAFTLSDGHAETAGTTNISVNVTGTNKTPVAIVEASIPAAKKGHSEGASTTISPQDWFTDANTADTLKFTSVTINSTDTLNASNLTATINGTVFTFDPTAGTLTIDSTNAVDLALAGTRVFSISATVDDGNGVASGAPHGEISTATALFDFTLTGVNQAPAGTAYAMAAGTSLIAESATSSIAIPLSSFGMTDPDSGDTVSISVETATGVFTKVTTTGSILLNGDTVQLDGVGNLLYLTTGTSLGIGHNVTATRGFDFKVIDSNDLSSVNPYTATVNIVGSNKSPLITKTTDTAGVKTETTHVFDPAAYATDANTGDTLHFTEITFNGTTINLAASGSSGGYQEIAMTGGTLRLYDLDYTAVANKAGKLEFIAGTTVATSEDFTFKITDGTATANELSTGTGTIGVSVVSGPSFDATKAEFAKAYGTTNSLDIASCFKGFTGAATYSIESVNGKDVTHNGSGKFVNFLDDASLAALVTGTLTNANLPLNFRAYSWNLQTSAIVLNVKATDGTETVTGTITIKPSTQYSVEFTLIATAARENDSELMAPGASITSVAAGANYYLQLWVKDTSNTIVGGSAVGILAGGIGLGYSPTVSHLPSVDSDSSFTVGGAGGGGIADGEEGAVSIAFVLSSVPVFEVDSKPRAVDGDARLSLQFLVSNQTNGLQTFTINEIVDTDGIYSVRVLSQTEDDTVVEKVHPSQIHLTSPSITVQQGPAATPLTAFIGPEVEKEGGVYMRTVTSPTEVGTDGAVKALPDNAAWIHEWQSHYVELWVKASSTANYTSAMTDLMYNTKYFTAVSVETGSTFTGTQSRIKDASGSISGIGGSAVGTVAKDGYILLGRVKFESQGNDNVPWSLATTPVSLGQMVAHPIVQTAKGETIAVAGRASNTELWAVPYDVDDSGTVGVDDFLSFVGSYGKKSKNGDTLISGHDYDRSSRVSSDDFLAFIGAYGKSRAKMNAGGQTLKFPAMFTQRYVGAKIQTDNTELVGAMLDAANKNWANALGVRPINVQLVIKDFGDASTLGEAVINELGPDGRPTKATITLDDNAAGANWYSQIAEPVAGGRYDLYTTFLHELGHVYGINANYSAYESVKYEPQFQGKLDAGSHVTDSKDVMFFGLNTGERKSISRLDTSIILAAYGISQNATISSSGTRLEAIAAKVESAQTVTDVMPIIPLAGAFSVVPVDARSLAELQLCGLAVAVQQTNVSNRGENVDAYFRSIPAAEIKNASDFNVGTEGKEKTELVLDTVIAEIDLGWNQV